MKIAIIYRGSIRGFKYEKCFQTHLDLYNKLKNNNIDFDIHLVTNNNDYDDNNIQKIPNLKTNMILDISNIKNTEDYNKAYNNIKFTGMWWETLQHNIITYWYNNNHQFNLINDIYDRYILLDIGQIIVNFDVKLLNNENINYVSIFESNFGYNT
jgi:hypothetical protein